MPPGRPSAYTDELAADIYECIASGDSAREAARKHDISEAVIRLWRDTKPEFSARYTRAVIARAEVFFERGNDIAMTIRTGEQAQIARVQLDWLKWAASKLGPKQYGDRSTLAGDPDAPLGI